MFAAWTDNINVLIQYLLSAEKLIVGPLFFIIMRLNLKIVLLCLCMAVCLLIVSVYMRCSDFSLPRDLVPRWERHLYNGRQDHYNEIDCFINQEVSIRCRRELDEVYIPFSFLSSYFEVYGTLTTDNGGVTRFNWSHSNSKVNYPKGKYDPRGLFMYFENYNVEVRDRVKCISASEGVPISTQWEKHGYFYPTQIAQFGLSHYSKNLTEPEPRKKILDDGDTTQLEWRIPKRSNLSRVWHTKLNTTVMYFTTTSHYDSAIQIQQLDHVLDLVLGIDLMLKSNSSSLMITIQNRETKRIFNIYYILADLLLSVQGENIYYGIGSNSINTWKHLTRDLLVDVQKGLTGFERKSMKIRRSELKISSISFLGVGAFDNLTLSTYEHLAHFYDAADWFVRHQDQKTGGWPNPVKRNLSGFVELQAGWYSAMGQGHAISLLSRAYWHSGGEKRYLKAAMNGMKPFRVLSKDGGVLAKFMGQYDWYEEYPTTPPSFVLNGFIYSLLGLYDLNSTAPLPIAREAGKLFQQGMRSLKKMLLLYDTGSGTSYDLRHFTLGVAPNLARWDYHATHVNQLLLLATIDNDPLISQTAERWKGYMFENEIYQRKYPSCYDDDVSSLTEFENLSKIKKDTHAAHVWFLDILLSYCL
ncbi:D-glucuronyl C5-epimerase B isoform X3 [Hermetia illucens]|uniref:D-glucuronyl C5-epimerase B isoform X3 n=1 Tax=Hermetia illucens TaxID=343691 RepID=UPI0018CC51CB|nr:D-glucuronyl C5-epimerase B isoform X3 [Hermetia illucens]